MSRRAAALAVLFSVVAAVLLALCPCLRRPTSSESPEPPPSATIPPAPLPPPGLAKGAAPRRRPARAGSRGAVVPADTADASPAPREIPFRLDTFDTNTGAAVASRWATSAELAALVQTTVLAVARGAAASPIRYPRESGREGSLPLSDSQSLPLDVKIDPPDRFVAWDVETRVHALAAGVARARARLPLRRAMALTVVVSAPSGAPAIDAKIVALEVAGRVVRVDPEMVAPGVFRFRAVPFLPGEPVAGGIHWDTSGALTVQPLPPSEGLAAPEFTTTIPAEEGDPWTVAVQLEGPVSRILDHNETDQDMPFEESYGEPAEGPRGRVRLKVFGWDGRPVPEVWTEGEKTDAEGVAILPAEAVGEREFHAHVPGRFPARATATVVEGRTIDVTLREPMGARVEVTVTDEEGRPRPAAHVSFDRLVFDVEDGVQRIDGFTDHLGRRSFARVEPGLATVTATWGTRRGSEKVLLKDGERTVVRLVAK